MPERTVKIKGFTYIKKVTMKDGSTREVRRLAGKGAVIDVSEEEAERGDRLGYFLDSPASKSSAPSAQDQRSGSSQVVDMSDDELDEWIATGAGADKKPSVSDVVAAAGGDAESANRLLQSEERVAASTGRDPRSGIAKGLASVIGSAD